MKFANLLTIVVLSAGIRLSNAADLDQVDFSREVLPILSNKCFVCHGPDTQDEDFLRLDSFTAATSDRGGYQAINPTAPHESAFLERIQSDDDPMPPSDAEKQLTEAERDILTRWIGEGGMYSQHWAFVAPKRAEAEDIDTLIQARLGSSDIQFAPPAKPTDLARRAALALTGLPPEPAQLQRFLTATESDPEAAYRDLVSSLLDSPRFGEHQARFWLDAVRYGDTHGLHLDNRRGIYPYRDWVVRAFNENLPIDDFITWQLAGDLLENPTLEQKIATGFVRLNPSTAEGGAIAAEFQAKNNFDRTETLGTVLLGMSLTCARCHTHKYDPIPQSEYYQLLAFFNNTAEKALDGNSYTYGPTVKTPANQTSWDAWHKLRARRAGLLKTAAERITERALTDDEEKIEWHKNDAARLAVVAQPEGSFAGDDLRTKAAALMTEFKALEESFTTTLVALELDKPRNTHVLKRGEYNLPQGAPLQPGILKAMGTFPKAAPRNRLGLAQWLTSPDHPLVARVLINRVWQSVFGYGLVRTPEDFGVQGEQPTHPELLDWLAVELQEQDWDLKHMLKLMVTSQTFRQSSAWREKVNDPENRLWARGPSYRLDAEVIRDIALWSSGLLDPHMGGEGVKPYQPSGMWMAMAHPASNTKKYERDQGARLYRRSLYVYWKRTSPHPMMTLFDAPDRESSCVRRSRTNTPLQSLALLNETQRVEMARSLADRLLQEYSEPETRIDAVYKMLACRPASPEERRACLQLLARMVARYEDASQDAQALVSIGDAQRSAAPAEELAAWTQLTATILASDVALLLY